MVQGQRLETAGLSVGDDDRVIFASPECLRLWTALDTMDRGVVVEGSPGLGKSVSVWAWTCYQAMSLEKKVLWIHVDKLMYQMCVYLSPDQCKVMESTGRSNLEDLMETTDADILVFDGYKSSIPLEDCINAVFPFESKSQRKGIVVSSKVGGLELDDFPPKLGNRITFFHFGPWLLDTSPLVPMRISSAQSVRFLIFLLLMTTRRLRQIPTIGIADVAHKLKRSSTTPEQVPGGCLQRQLSS